MIAETLFFCAGLMFCLLASVAFWRSLGVWNSRRWFVVFCLTMSASIICGTMAGKLHRERKWAEIEARTHAGEVSP